MTVNGAILDRLRAAVSPTYDGDVPTSADGAPLAQRYAALYPDPGSRLADDLGFTADRFVFRWQVTSVGRSRDQAEWVAVRCRDALLDSPLTATGWDLGPVTHESSSPIRKDTDIPGVVLFFAADTYSLTATR